MTSLVDLIKKHLDNDYFGCGIFIDLQKVFDTVNHIFLAKLVHYGIRGLTNSWFSSFLKNRTQYVYLDGHFSITKQVTCGVPQGSTLGILLFLMYINDLQGFIILQMTLTFYFLPKHLALLNVWLTMN